MSPSSTRRERGSEAPIPYPQLSVVTGDSMTQELRGTPSSSAYGVPQQEAPCGTRLRSRSVHAARTTNEEGLAMATATTTVRGVVPGTKLRVGSLIMAIGGAGFIGYAIIFFVRNFTGFLELGIGRGEVSVSKTEIKHFSPSLYDYISHLHIALSGFIAASGLAVIALAWFGVRRGQSWAWVLAVAVPAHYPNHLDTVGHLGLIYVDTVLFVVGAVVAFLGLREQSA